MIINYPQKKQIPLGFGVNEINTPQDSINQFIQNVDDEKRKNRLESHKVSSLITLFNINEHDNCLVFYLTGNEPNIKNNKDAIGAWVKAELAEDNIEILNIRFKNLLSRIDPSADFSEF